MEIGSQIRQLRREKGWTQEDLAGYLHLSSQAVSKWENGVALPDVTLIPAIARFLGVSTDRLFGFDDSRDLERIQEILMTYQENFNQGQIEANENLLRDGLRQYPANYQLMAKLCGTLFNLCDGPRREELLGEIIQKCEVILRDCTEDDPRYTALQLLVYAHTMNGEREKAREIVQRLPSISVTQESLLQSILEGEEKTEQIQKNLLTYLDSIGMALEALSRDQRQSQRLREALFFLDLYENLYESFFEKGDYHVYHARLLTVSVKKAQVKMGLKESWAAVGDLEQAVRHAIAFDQLSGTTPYTSRCFDRLVFHPQQVLTNGPESQREICKLWLEMQVFDPLRESPQFRALLDALGG